MACGCGKTFRTERQYSKHLEGKRDMLHTGWPGQVTFEGNKLRLSGGARPVIGDEKPSEQLSPGPCVPIDWRPKQ
jgi:hypothetical protein